MPYSKTTWKDRAVEHPRTYTIQDNGDGTITLVPAPGTVYEQGTPVNAANLNKIEQGIADATATAEAALPRAGGTVTGRVIAELGFDGAYSWGTFSSSSNGNAMIAQNAYLHPTDGTYRYRATHTSIGARGIVFLWSIPEQAAVPHWFDMGRIATTADAAFTPVLHEIITSAGGQQLKNWLRFKNGGEIGDDTSNTYIKANGDSFDLIKKDNSAYIMRVSNSGLFTFLGNDIWHTGQLRNNNGLLELYYGGDWIPVSGAFIPFSERKGASGQPSISPINTWTTLVNLNMRGRLERVNFGVVETGEGSGESFTGTFRVTVDNKVVWQTTANATETLGEHLFYLGGFNTDEQADYLYFNSNFKIEAQVDNIPSAGANVRYEVGYRQAIN